MRRFILERNIERFESALRRETDVAQRRILAELLAQAKQKLADLESEERQHWHVRPPRHEG